MKGKNTFFIILISTISLIYFSALDDYIIPWGDAYQYLMHSKNIAQSKTYSETYYIQNPYFIMIGPKQYPPGLPFLLAPLYAIWKENMELPAKFLQFIMFILSGIILINLLKNKIGKLEIAIILIIFFFNLKNWYYINKSIVSEVPFFLFSFLLINFYSKSINKLNLLRSILLGIFLYIPFSIRSAGIALAIAYIATILFNRRFKLKFIIPIIIFGILFFLQRIYIGGSTDDYINMAKTFLGMKEFSITEYVFLSLSNLISKNVNEILSLGRVPLLIISISVGTAFIFVVIKGILAQIKNSDIFLETYILITSIIAILWIGGTIRFLLPVLPFILMFFFLGIKNTKYIDKFYNFITYGGLALSIFYLFLLIVVKSDYFFGTTKDEEEAKRITKKIYDFTKKYIPENAVIIHNFPRQLGFYAERKSSIYPGNYDVQKKYYCDIKANYIITLKKFPYYPFRQNEEEIIKPFIKNNKNKLILVFSTEEFEIYKISNKLCVE